MLLVPKVHARLVLDFDRNTQWAKHPIHPLLHACFGISREICGIEVEDIAILDPVLRRAAGLQVPNCLEQASGDQPPILQTEIAPRSQDGPVVAIGQDVCDEALVLGLRQSA